MLMLLAAAATAIQSQPGKPVATARAQATINIVSLVKLRVGATSSEDGRPVQRSTVLAQDGTRQPAMLVQFE